MNTLTIDRLTVAIKRAEAESFELRAKRLRRQAREIERRLIKRISNRK